MAQKPEARFVTWVNKGLPETIHHQSMAGTFVNGTPDQYYEGPRGAVLWVEYKWLPSTKPRKVVFHELCSPLQRLWITRAAKNGVAVAVIVGTPGGALISRPASWERYDLEGFVETYELPILIKREAVRSFIIHQLT